MSTGKIMRPFEMDGSFELIKSGRGKRRLRLLVFRTRDGFEGVSRTFSRREAYEAAMAARAKASFNKAIAGPKPAPEAKLLHTLDESTLFSEVERRGYEVVVAS